MGLYIYRKTLSKWATTVKVESEEGGGGVAGTLNDGYSWRKYGQKVILGAAFPRSEPLLLCFSIPL